MIPVTLALRNFMCYRDGDDAGLPLALNLDGIHVACLSGENGAGKSALLDAITWALWGEARMADDELIAQGESEMEVDLIFALGDQPYRVIRKRQAGKTGSRGGKSPGKSAVDLQISTGGGWRTLSENTVGETQAKINDLLRMRYKTFINASFLLQGRADEFTRKLPSERKEVLAEMLDLGEYAALEQRAKDRAKGLSDQSRGLEGQIEQLGKQAAQRDFWAGEVATAELALAALIERFARAQVAKEQADSQLHDLQAKAEQRKELLRRLNELRAQQQAQDQELAELQAQIIKAEELLGRRAAIGEGLAALGSARAEQARLDGLRPRYDELRERYRELSGEIKDEQRRIESQRDAARSEAERLGRLAARRPEVHAALAALDAQLAALRPLGDELATLRQQREALDIQIARLNELLRQRGELVAQIEKRQDSLVAVREEQSRTLKRLERDLRDAPRWQAELAAASAAQGQAAALAVQVAALRDHEHGLADEAGELRARCNQLKQQADQLKKDRDRLSESEATSCPVCRSDLGADGLGHVLAHYERDLVELREGYRATSSAAKNLDAELVALRGRRAAEEIALGQAQQAAARGASLAEQVARAVEWQREHDQARLSLDTVERQIAAKEFARAEQTALVALDAELAALSTAEPRAAGHAPQAMLKAFSAEREALRRRADELDGRLAARPALEGQAEARRREMGELEAVASELPAISAQVATVEATLAGEEFAHALRVAQADVRAEADSLGYSREAYDATTATIGGLIHWEKAERELHTAEIRLESDHKLLDQALKLREIRSAESERLTREDALLEEQLRALPRAQARAEEDKIALQRSQFDMQTKQKDLGEKQGYLNSAQAAADQLSEAETRLRGIQERQGLFAELAEAFGKKGVQAMLIESAIPQIEDEANRLLGRMTDGQMHVSFAMQRETKKGDAVETLDIAIADALGTRPYDAFSGGEALRANFAIRIALSKLLARRAGARLETLVIDEGFGALDALGRERMVEAITEVQRDFRRIVVITHIDELKERFPIQIEVIKGPRGSRWELR